MAIEQSQWIGVLDDLREARTIFLLGATDTGKTTFLTWLANQLQARGRQVAIIDADVGQSSLGPPTTIGLGMVAHPFQNLQELSPTALYFVGSTSPRGHLLPVIIGTKHMLDRALRLDVDQVIIDTCGFVGADGGQALKQHQIDLTSPDRLVCLQRADECEPILRAFRYRQRPHLVRLQASPACRRRSMEERRLHRERSLRQYFTPPKIITLQWDDLNLVAAPVGTAKAWEDWQERVRWIQVKRSEILWAEPHGGELSVVVQSPLPPSAIVDLERAVGRRIRTWLVAELHGTLLGLLDEAGEALGIGVLRQLHFDSRCLEILTAEGIEGIGGVYWSRTRLEPGGELRRLSEVRS